MRQGIGNRTPLPRVRPAVRAERRRAMSAEYYEFELSAWIPLAIMGALLLLVGVIAYAVVRKRRRP